MHCLSVCSLAASHISLTTCPTSISVHVACGRGWLLLWWQCNTLCTSGFVGDVMFAYNRPSQDDANRTYTQWLTGGQHRIDVYGCLVAINVHLSSLIDGLLSLCSFNRGKSTYDGECSQEAFRHLRPKSRPSPRALCPLRTGVSQMNSLIAETLFQNKTVLICRIQLNLWPFSSHFLPILAKI